MSSPNSVQQERDAIDSRRALAILALSLLVAAAAVVSSRLIHVVHRAEPAPLHASSPAFSSNTPERTTFDHDERGLALRARQREALNHYGWAERDAGIAQIPIARAIDVELELEPGGTR